MQQDYSMWLTKQYVANANRRLDSSHHPAEEKTARGEMEVWAARGFWRTVRRAMYIFLLTVPERGRIVSKLIQVHSIFGNESSYGVSLSEPCLRYILDVSEAKLTSEIDFRKW